MAPWHERCLIEYSGWRKGRVHYIPSGALATLKKGSIKKLKGLGCNTTPLEALGTHQMCGAPTPPYDPSTLFPNMLFAQLHFLPLWQHVPTWLPKQSRWRL